MTHVQCHKWCPCVREFICSWTYILITVTFVHLVFLTKSECLIRALSEYKSGGRIKNYFLLFVVIFFFDLPYIKVTLEIGRLENVVFFLPVHDTMLLHCFSQGMLNTTSEVINNSEVMMALWKHECTRVIADRFTEITDKDWFEKTIKQVRICHRCKSDWLKRACLLTKMSWLGLKNLLSLLQMKRNEQLQCKCRLWFW